MSLEKVGASDNFSTWENFMRTEVGRDVQSERQEGKGLDDGDTDDIEALFAQRDSGESPQVDYIEQDVPIDDTKEVASDPYGEWRHFANEEEGIIDSDEDREQKRSDLKRRVGKGVLAVMVAAGVFMGGVFVQDGLEKSLRQSDYNDAMKNHIWANYNTTATMETTPQDVYQNIERGLMEDRAEEMYDARNGEGAFDELGNENESVIASELDESGNVIGKDELSLNIGKTKQEALVNEVYDFYDRENPAADNVNPDYEEWAEGEIDSETGWDHIVNWFDKE